MLLWHHNPVPSSYAAEDLEMPYSSIDQLPPPVRDNLPEAAQHIFVKAFNAKYAQLKPGESEVPAFKIAWSAVKRTYEKRDGKWQLKRKRSAREHKKAS
jgi:cation transport regulator